MGSPTEELREGTEGVEGVCNPVGRTTISTNWTPQSCQGLNYQPKSIYMEGYMALTIAEDCLIWHHWEGRCLLLWRLVAPMKVDAAEVNQEWVGGLWSTLL